MGYSDNVTDVADTVGGKWWYVGGKTARGKIVFLGKYKTEEEADEQLARLRDGRTFCYATRNYSAAKAMWRAELMKEGADMDETLRPSGRKLDEVSA